MCGGQSVYWGRFDRSQTKFGFGLEKTSWIETMCVWLGLEGEGELEEGGSVCTWSWAGEITSEIKCSKNTMRVIYIVFRVNEPRLILSFNYTFQYNVWDTKNMRISVMDVLTTIWGSTRRKIINCMLRGVYRDKRASGDKDVHGHNINFKECTDMSVEH